jgi:GWxTD domain-containing protein
MPKETIAIIFFLFQLQLFGQVKFTGQYVNGMENLIKKDTLKAESFFKESIDLHKDAPSYYQLGIIQKSRTSFNTRNEALDNLKQAALRDSGNITYRLEYALLLEEFAIYSAVNEYKDIITEFPGCTQAFIRLGEIKMKEYDEFRNSKKIGSEEDARFDFNLSETAKNDFSEAEQFFSNALKIDSLSEDALYGLGRLYENSGNFKKSILLLNKIISGNPANKNAHLILGMLYHRTGNEKQASEQFGKALDLMSYSERDDFIYNSALLLITPAYGDNIKHLSKEDIELTIERFWKASNPLLLSEQNERLLEHYSRMAYANLYFGVPKLKLEGWKTDRGEVLLRYGIPKGRSKTRPYLSGGGAFFSKSDMWLYDDFSLTFDDYNMNGNFKLSWDRGQSGRFSSSLRSNTASYETFEQIKKEVVQMYAPAKKQFEVNKEIYCFKNLENSKPGTYDSYLAFEIPVRDSLGRIKQIFPKYETGIFLFDNDFYTLFEKRSSYNKERVGRILADKLNSDKVDNIKFDLPSDSVSLAFEVRKLSDSSFYSYHALIEGPAFSSESLDVSDLMIASAVDMNKEISGAIKRNDIYVVPKVELKFRNDEPIYLYYEAYNLTKSSDGLTDFEQIITIKENSESGSENGLEKFLKGIKDFLFGSKSKISLSSSYRTKEADSQQYIQIDFSRLPAGIYDLILEVFDKVSGKKVEKKLSVEIAEESK